MKYTVYFISIFVHDHMYGFFFKENVTVVSFHLFNKYLI